MPTLNKLFQEQIAHVPAIFLSNMIRNKLSEQGVEVSDGALKAFTDHLMAGNDGPITIDDCEPDLDVEIKIEKEDIDDLIDSIDRFLDTGVQDLVESVSDDIAKQVSRTFKSDWLEFADYDAIEFAEFRARLEERWGDALDLTRMLLSASYDLGDERQKKYRRKKSPKNMTRDGVLLMLHARGCQVMKEIVTLLENGLADGAIARWRTLHELFVVMSIIDEHGDETAQRYLDHEVVESKKGADVHNATCQALGDKPLSKRDQQHINREYEQVIKKYGRSFGNDYGWASEALQKERPTFSDLENVAGHHLMRGHYKLASFNVHAGAKGVTYRLGSLSEDIQLVGGASNAGLEQPGANAVTTLSKINSFMYGPRMGLDQIVQMKAMLLLTKEAEKAFYKAARKLERDERALNKSRKKK